MMKKYFVLQLKRVLRFLPGVLFVIALLLGALAAVPRFVMKQDAHKEENKKYTFALCGETDDDFLQMSLAAVSAMDSSRFTLEILQMSEAEAQMALKNGHISAYVVFPEGFMDAANSGELIPLKMVSTAGASNLGSIFKEELTAVVGELLSNSEKGAFGLDDAMTQQGLGHQSGEHMNRLALEYVDHILVRDQVYKLEELGIADRLDLQGYLICGLGVVFALLCCLPFAPLQIRKDAALSRLLRAKGHNATIQTLCDFGAYGLILLVITGALLPLLALIGPPPLTFGAVLKGIPVVLMAAAYSFMLFRLADDLMSGILLQFFLTLGLCFVSGCIYPVHFFPVGVQKLASWLPTGLARTQLAGCITGERTGAATLALLGYSVVFVGISIAVQSHKIREVER